MWLMYVTSRGALSTRTVHLVNENGEVEHSCGTVSDAVSWLACNGHDRVGVPTDTGVDVFLIECRSDLGQPGTRPAIRRDPFASSGDHHRVNGLDLETPSGIHTGGRRSRPTG